MAQNTDIDLTAGAWTLLTNSDVSAVRVHNKSGYLVQLQATVGETEPTSTGGSIPLRPGETLTANDAIANLWPGVAGAVRVYALSKENALVSVSHA